ncbi:MAG: phosphatidylglycerophosphatase A [Acidobacteriaceae bacterium]
MTKQRTSWAWALATFFGTGFLRPAPGTWGSLAGLLLWLVAAHWLHPSRLHLAIGTAIAALIALLLGIPASAIVAREAATDDPSFVVLDEVAGQWVALIGVALIAATPRLWEWVAAFLLFRIFDILKPSPAREFDRMHSGFGIMMDDIAAGVYALVILWLAGYFLLGRPL